MLSPARVSSRAVVTGFCAAHPRLAARARSASSPRRAGWVEYSCAGPPDLRALFDAEAEYSAAPAGKWWEAFLSCGIIGALEASGLRENGRWNVEATRVGICFSSSKGRPAQWEETAEAKNGANFDISIPANGCDWALREVSRASGARGKMLCPVAACASGAHAIAIGAQWIEDGVADVVICGAMEADLASLVLACYRQMGALSASGVMRPFDRDRDGFVPSPGAACVILENAQIAADRNARVLGRIAGWSLLADATSLTGLDATGEPIARAMREALKRASTRRVDYVNAHGTATSLNDATEARAIARVLGPTVPVSSTKALTGHLLGAAGAVEAVLCLLAMQQNFAPPTWNLQTLDEKCEIEVLRAGRATPIETALSLSYGFGGHIGVLILEKM